MRHLLVFFALTLARLNCIADFVNDGSSQYYGSIKSIDGQKVVLRNDCGNSTTEFSWSSGISVEFNLTCKHPGWNLSQSPLTAETNCAKRRYFKFLLKEKGVVTYADEFNASNGILIIKYANTGSIQKVSFDNIEEKISWLIVSEECQSEVPSSPSMI